MSLYLTIHITRWVPSILFDLRLNDRDLNHVGVFLILQSIISLILCCIYWLESFCIITIVNTFTLLIFLSLRVTQLLWVSLRVCGIISECFVLSFGVILSKPEKFT